MSGVIRALHERAREFPGRLALADERQTLSFGRLPDRVHARTRELQQLGSRVLGLLADNCVDWVLTDLAALAGGIVVVPIPPWFTIAQRRHLIETSGIDTLLVDDQAGTTRETYGFGAVATRIGRFEVLKTRQPLATGPMKLSMTAKVTFTSGSTGQPKGVRIAGETLDQVSMRLRQVLAELAIDKHLCVMPLATLLENIAGLYVPLMLGASVHVPSVSTLGLSGSSRFDARRFRNTLDECGAQSLILTPELLRALTMSFRSDSSRNEQLKFVAVGGARVSDSEVEAAAEAGIPAYQGYGLSECASVVALNLPGARRVGSVGRPIPGVGVDVSDDGEIVVRNQCMRGYLGNPDEEFPAVATGDLGYLDDDGFLYVTGRRKNLFITSYGRNVAPEWPEAELLAQPEIAQAAVFGEARPTNIAVIVPAGSGRRHAAMARAVRAANGALPDYARIGEWIIADEPFSPANGLMTVTGKVRRQDIACRYLEEGVRARSGGPSHPLSPSIERTDHEYV